jgi:hypothetical protein
MDDAGNDDRTSPSSGCGIDTWPPSGVPAATVEEVMVKVTVEIPAFVVVADKICALVTFRFPLPLTVPITVIRLPTTGTFPEAMRNVKVPVVVTAESEIT